MTIIAAGLALLTSVVAAGTQTLSTAPVGMNYFASGSYQGAITAGKPTRTQGVGEPSL